MVRKGSTYAHIRSADGEKVCETGATEAGIDTLRKIAEVANRYPAATPEQLTDEAMTRLL